MKISTKGRYGLRAMLDLSLHYGEGNISLSDIAARQDLSLNYMESIFSALKRSGLVLGMAGAKGGYQLARPAQEITLKEILDILEGDMSISDSVTGDCSKIRSFLKENVWDQVDADVEAVLSGTTLAEMSGEFQAQGDGGCDSL